MARDIQELMKSDLARARPSRPATRPKAPGSPIDIGPVWVVACFAGGRPRFLNRTAAGWTVVLDADRAHRFDDQAAAQRGLEDFQRRHTGGGSGFDAGAAWCVKEMTLRATFR